jgi:hypothetical protein
MNTRVAVYQLSHKFINRREDVPENARQVVYYALAVGHHVGVMDCFSSVVDIPMEDFSGWVEGLPEGPGRTKLEGVMKWGEVEINRSHVGLLLPLMEGYSDRLPWVSTMVQCLQGIVQEPGLYLMLRKYA